MSLSEPYPISDADVATYQSDGFIHLNRVLSADDIRTFGDVISKAVIDLNTMHLPMDERGTYDK